MQEYNPLNDTWKDLWKIPAIGMIVPAIMVGLIFLQLFLGLLKSAL